MCYSSPGLSLHNRMEGSVSTTGANCERVLVVHAMRSWIKENPKGGPEEDIPDRANSVWEVDVLMFEI